MTRPFIPFLAFVILLMLTLHSSFDFATSVAPGWHTTIYPPYFVWVHLVIIVLLLATIGFWLISKQTDRTNWILFAIHFVLTIPTTIFLKVPSIFLQREFTNQDKLLEALQFRIRLIPIAWTLFIAGQILFLVYFIRIVRTKNVAT